MKWLANECFANDIIRGLLRRAPNLDLVRAQDISGLAGRNDETLLAWAGKHERVVLSHDLATMVAALGLPLHPPLASIVLVSDSLPASRVIEDVLLPDQC